MPEMSCLFASSTPRLVASLLADPDVGDRVHVFHACEGLDLAGGALAVVFLSGAVGRPWPEAEGCPHPAELPPLPEPEARQWLAPALPPAAVITRWTALARDVRQPLAWWWWWERGDDLYADAGILFHPDDAPVLLTRTTFLTSDEERGLIHRAGHAPAPLARAPLQEAMAHLGFTSTLQYFAPTDQWRFDWSRYRVQSTSAMAAGTSGTGTSS